MRKTVYRAEDLERFLMRNVVATMLEIQDFLGTPVYKTVLRKLKQLSYRSSYSHGGSYYTLEKLLNLTIEVYGRTTMYASQNTAH